MTVWFSPSPVVQNPLPMVPTQMKIIGKARKPRSPQPRLLDGHNRFDICERHGLSFATVEFQRHSRGGGEPMACNAARSVGTRQTVE
jgi:hypothetical protein